MRVIASARDTKWRRGAPTPRLAGRAAESPPAAHPSLEGRPPCRPTWTRTLLAAASALALAGCATTPSADSPRTGSAHATAADRNPPAAERNRVLFNYRLGATALRLGQDDEAKARFDDAILRIGGIITNDAQAAKARSLFSAEATKPFVGEPYERVMAYYYRGILYWRDGQPDNARACFRSGQVIDSDPDNARYTSDYVLLDYLDGFASVKLGADGSDAFARAQQLVGGAKALPPYDAEANVLIFAEYGYGPRKYAGGEFGEQLRFYADDSPSRSARLILEGGKTVPLPAYDDLGWQASTRGGRAMDHILGNKAVFKQATNSVGDVALVGSVIASDEARRRKREGRDNDDANVTAVSLGVIGLLGKIASAATQTQADIRQWDNLPQRLSFAALKLAPGEHHGRLEFLDREGTVLERRSQRVTISVPADGRDAVVFLSELKG